MFAHVLPESTYDEPNLLDVIPWLDSLVDDYDPAVQHAESYMLIDPIGMGLYSDLDIEEHWAPSLMNVAKCSMPDVYQQFVGMHWLMSDDEFVKYAGKVIEHHLPEPDSGWVIEEPMSVHYIPYDAYGENFCDPDWVPPFSIEPFCELLGYELLEDEFEGAYWDTPYDKTRILTCMQLVFMLEETTNPVFHNIAMLLRWMRGQTENSLSDYSVRNLQENGVEPFYWEQLDYAHHVQRQAQEFFLMAMAGRDVLLANPLLFNALESTYQTIYRTFDTDEAMQEMSITEATHVTIDLFDEFPFPEPDLEGEIGITETQARYSDIRPWRDAPPREAYLRY